MHGELAKLGISISQAAVSKYMVRHRTPPSHTWRSFLDNHANDLVSLDFFTLPTATFRVLFVFIVLRHDRRRIVHFNVTEHPSAEWTAQQMVDAFPWDTAPRYLVRDRDQTYGAYFDTRVDGLGIEQVCLLFIHPPAHGSEVSPAARNTLDSARIPRASKLLICGLFLKGRVLAQDGVLAEHGIAPAPERGKSMSWSTFLKAHWGAIAATDLFTVEVVNPFGLVRYHVLFVIDIATRCVCIGGITSDPNGEWMKQVARNLTDMWDGFLHGKRYLIHDRDPLFTEAVRGLLRDSGVKPLRLPANSPNLNAYAERFVLSIRRECLDRFVPLSERHLRTAVTEYVVHYHTERNHQGIGNELITPLPASANDAGPIVSRERLGGILNYYYRAA